MQLRNTVVNMRVLQLKHTRRSRRKSTLTFMLKLVVHLFIKRYPWLHATPDFLCYCTLCDCCGEGCREVKCPYCLMDTDLKDYPDKSSSCLKSEKGTTSLKREHAYYYQTQQQIQCIHYWIPLLVLLLNELLCFVKEFSQSTMQQMSLKELKEMAHRCLFTIERCSLPSLISLLACSASVAQSFSRFSSSPSSSEKVFLQLSPPAHQFLVFYLLSHFQATQIDISAFSFLGVFHLHLLFTGECPRQKVGN